MTQGEHVKEIRKALGLTLEKFGEKVGVGKTAISNIEKGNRNLTEQMIKSICREFNVNEEWLRTGTGEMFVSLTRNELIADFMTDLLKEEEESFRKRLIEAFAGLDSSDWEDLERIAMKIIKRD